MATLAPTIRFESLEVDTVHHQLLHIAQDSFLGTESELAAKSYVGNHLIVLIPTETIFSTSNYTLSPLIRYPGTNNNSLSTRMRLRAPTVNLDCQNFDLESGCLQLVLLAMSST